VESEVSFVELFNAVLKSLGRRHPRTPGQALEVWSDFVDDCEEGYSASLFEYWNDLWIRRFLQSLLDSPDIRRAPDAAWFIDEVEKTDLRFKSLISDGYPVPGGWGWWERALPRHAGEDMARDVREQYGFEMETAE
jgi:hypothetical protein